MASSDLGVSKLTVIKAVRLSTKEGMAMKSVLMGKLKSHKLNDTPKAVKILLNIGKNIPAIIEEIPPAVVTLFQKKEAINTGAKEAPIIV